MSQKYAIAKNRGVNAFFTKSSSYDRPQWVNESAASTFLSVEAAEAAAKKLYKHGAYEARVVPIKEAIELELPDDQPTDPLAGELDDPEGAAYPEDDGEEKPEMVARVQTTTVDIPAYSDEVDADGDPASDVEDFDDPLATLDAGDLPPEDDPDAVVPSLERPEVPLQRSLRRESFEMPARATDATNSDNANTVVNGAPKYDKIEYKNPAVTSTDDYAAPVACAEDDAVTVPANVKSDLAKAIADFKKQADFSNTIDDTRSSFCLTVAAAFERLQELLNVGTVAGLKQAQIFMQTWMNPITTNLPVSVTKFVESGGRKSTLKDLFDTKWDAKRNEQ